MGAHHKIVNDPLHGFITLSHPGILDLVEMPVFQRLRYIAQMGLSYLVFPGAHHTRWQHAIGAMHLMHRATEVLQFKGIEISPEEKKAVLSAILLHDIGHGPFSHALEYAIIQGIDHEHISLAIMERLNRETGGELDLALRIFKNEYPKTFLHELISSQLDTDRLDYLQRDSFFTGVVEGRINAPRIIEMLNVVDNRLTVDEKGLYSVEKFIVSRRFMYWQVYLHKTSFMFEKVLEQALRRAKMLHRAGETLYLDEDLKYFFDRDQIRFDDETYAYFTRLTDNDILVHLKKWTSHADPILSYLAHAIVHRRPMQIDIRKEPFGAEEIEKIKKASQRLFGVDREDLSYLILEGEMSHTAYDKDRNPIRILTKNGEVKEFSEVTDHFYIRALSQEVRKFYLIYAKNL